MTHAGACIQLLITSGLEGVLGSETRHRADLRALKEDICRMMTRTWRIRRRACPQTCTEGRCSVNCVKCSLLRMEVLELQLP